MNRKVVQHTAYKKGAKGTAKDHADYIAGIGKNAGKEDVIYVEDGNLPAWAKDASDFFDAADQFEREDGKREKKTKNGERYEKTSKARSYIEFEWAIQRGIGDPISWARQIAEEALGKNFVYRLAIHDAPAKDGGRNINMHLMFSERRLDGIERGRELFFSRANTGSYRHRKTGELIAHDPAKGGTKKDRFWNHKDRPKWARKLYERHVQLELPDFKLDKSEFPEPKIGPKLKKAGPAYEAQRAAIESTVMEMRAVQHEIEATERELAIALISPRPLGGISVTNKGRNDARWQEFERVILGVGQCDLNLSLVVLSPAIDAIEAQFSELADTLERQGKGVADLARMLAEQLAKAEFDREQDCADQENLGVHDLADSDELDKP